jgi:ABC-2 type transport system permease protein
VARLFFRLKLRLISNGMRGNHFRVISLVFGALFGLQFALFGFTALAVPPEGPDAHTTFPVIGFTLLFVGWAMVPVFGFGLDETLDPSRLMLLPLSRSQLVSGLFVASATGIAPAATLVALSGAILGYASFGIGTPIVAAGVTIEFALCLVAARAVTTAASRALRSRRARDVWVICSFLFILALNALFQLARFLDSRDVRNLGDRFVGLVRWFPPGMLGRAVVDADGGHFAVAALQLVPALAILLLLTLWWAGNVERLTTRVEAAATPPRRVRIRPSGRERATSTLYPWIAAFLPRNRWGAVAAKDLRYLWREPAQRAQRLSTFLFALGAVVAVALVRSARQPSTTLAATAFLWWFSLMAMGQFGIDRTAYWMNVVASGDPQDDLVGKNAAIALVNLPAFLGISLAVAALTHGWVYLPVALGTGLGVLGVALGVGNVTSVRLAQPIPESPTNLWAQRTGTGFGTAFIMLGVLLVSQLLVAPVAALVLIGLYAWTPMLAVAVPVSIGWGATIYLIGRHIAAGWLRRHEAELLAALGSRSE